MTERRVVFSIGVVYQTEYEILKKTADMLRKVVDDQHYVRFDRAHFKGYAEFALIFEIVYYVLSPPIRPHT
ncbi:hypothetical protein DSCA_00370 [Desulfosarcina alkanivorans]|uniref:Mechanosensitive ion channel MscS C-terminal domain-containing protein n=1 Tax=Desulfosarcina alkanivorans TaxID=571177 RepID=A0A5K7YNE5_9BACT|nr:hypothetical protein DSCA_00370 [Desulfosarcina alkanivorans]